MDARKKANLAMERHSYAGVPLEFFGLAAVVQEAKEARRYAAGTLTAAGFDPSATQ